MPASRPCCLSACPTLPGMSQPRSPESGKALGLVAKDNSPPIQYLEAVSEGALYVQKRQEGPLVSCDSGVSAQH